MSKKKSTKKEEFKKEDVLQAVIIADSFDNKFSPITLNKPKALLPLANLSLIDYTLEFLWVSGVQSVIVYCCAHANQIIDHLQTSKWSSQTSPMDVVTITGDSRRTHSLGDAMRELDSRSLLVNDFVLVNCDTIGNLDLADIIARHKERRIKDKYAVMTMCLKPSREDQRTRCRRTDFTVTLRNPDNRVLTYQLCNDTTEVCIPLDMLKDHQTMTVRGDLQNCEVVVCASHVPTIFTDNFDYQTFNDFVKGILIDEEISGNAIYAELIPDQYAARASSLFMYDALSKDVMDRWLYPIVPDTNIGCGSDCQYNYGRHNTYLHKSVSLARNATLKRNVIIAKSTTVGLNTWISQSVIGQGCIIGDNVILKGAYLMDYVTIGNGCKITEAMLDTGVIIKDNVTLSGGTILACGVIVGPDVVLPASIRLTKDLTRSLRRNDSEPTGDTCRDDDRGVGDKLLKPVPTDIIGKEGRGYYFINYDTDEEDDEAVDVSSSKLWDERIYSEHEDDLYEPESDLSDQNDEDDLDGDFDDELEEQEDDISLFYNEVVMTLDRALTENIKIENLIVEINSLKHAYNIKIQELNTLVTKVLFTLPLSGKDGYMISMKKDWKKVYLPLFTNYISNESSQKDCLVSLEDVCLTNAEARCSIPLRDAVYLLYQADILEEEAIVYWYKHPDTEAADAPERKALREKLAALIDWFEDADEESE